MARSLFPVLGTLIAAVLGGLGSTRSAELYTALDKPAWAPPAALFGPVWSVLYIMIAVAGVLLVRRQTGDPRVSSALRLYTAQLALNALWPWLFFKWRLGGVAFAEILVLGAVLVLTVLAFARIRPLPAALLIPYLVWVSYAGALNWAVWRRNPELLGLSNDRGGVGCGQVEVCSQQREDHEPPTLYAGLMQGTQELDIRMPPAR